MLRSIVCILSTFLFFLPVSSFSQAQTGKPAVIAYYSGGPGWVDSFDVNKITHVIFSFGHLKGNRLNIDRARDTLTIQKLVAQKTKNPALKVMLSLGGWGGCKNCSDVFSEENAREEFAASVKELLDYFQADGIDLDWEYPTIPGHPGHPYKAEDKNNFTALVKQLRKKLGRHKAISFAAGGFATFLEQSVDWKQVMKYCDFVNMMTYDLVNGFSTTTGHHTPLFSTPQQKESSDFAISYLQSIGIPPGKIVLGAAFYGRIFDSVQNINNGLYQPGRFKSYIPTKFVADRLTAAQGYHFYWDDTAKAAYGYSPDTRSFVTYEDARSIALKARYAADRKLFGIMFWQMTEDKPSGGLLQAIDDALKAR